ncbi:MAG TPA: biosynthetic arginine decarboxylase, partial [Kofleriaceae bacterium]|nr:biosynthetic arginine decarboxylase [Kofleriaceae bacterium]
MADSLELYSIERWSSGYFSINPDGNIIVTPRGRDRGSVDLKALVDELQRRGIQLPLLIRFSDILRSRIELLNRAFAQAIADMSYQGVYRGVYPIKVNQSRVVVEEIVDYGRPFHYGLEAGSKPELLAVMALHRDEQALVVCNGYKDDEYIRTALLASRLGPTVVIVAEKPTEIDHIHKVARDLGVKPTIGIRARLSARGSGKWQQSGGDRSKFGLSAAEMLEAIEKLRAWGELDCLRLLHFHLGSQISNIRSIQNALREAGRFYVELFKLGCHGIKYLDVGGGLGVDYDGSQTNFASSMNYSVQEYANDVVFEIQQVCDEASVPHPDIVSESGRAVAAHHSVLIVDVLEVSQPADYAPPTEVPDDSPVLVKNLLEAFQGVTPKNLLESYHDAAQYRDQALQLFNLGHLSLQARVMCDQLYWAISKKILGFLGDVKEVPEDLEHLERNLCDTYFLNFSMFQSLPDHWAVDQLFPIVPIHRLNQRPTRRGVLADITCDSDGKIDSFIDPRDVKKVLELHPVQRGEPYYLGIFLVGAYQEILGDLHNLFGDTNTVHVSIDDHGLYTVEEVFPGDTVTDVLQYVNYSASGLMKRLRQ